MSESVTTKFYSISRRSDSVQNNDESIVKEKIYDCV